MVLRGHLLEGCMHIVMLPHGDIGALCMLMFEHLQTSFPSLIQSLLGWWLKCNGFCWCFVYLSGNAPVPAHRCAVRSPLHEIFGICKGYYCADPCAKYLVAPQRDQLGGTTPKMACSNYVKAQGTLQSQMCRRSFSCLLLSSGIFASADTCEDCHPWWLKIIKIGDFFPRLSSKSEATGPNGSQAIPSLAWG